MLTTSDGPLVLDNPAAMRAWALQQRRSGATIALVPTMGALHDGHAALVRRAQAEADLVVVSIFVNPLQFNRRDDFDAYPRPIEDDVRQCADVGVDVVYAPTAAAMYPPDFQTHVTPGALAEPLEGVGRPGHFRGVTTVVTKLFAAVSPDVAVFGQKDFQQLAIIRQMTADLDLGVAVVGLPTVRESDGVAMSSRNRRLSPANRVAAACISAGMAAAARAWQAGEHNADVLLDIATAPVAAEPLATIEYLSLIDPHTLQPVHGRATHALVVAAVWFGDVRLIDNWLLSTTYD